MFQVKINHGDNIEEKTQEVQADIDAYRAAQEYQLENGGPGPVADYEIMAIVNEHNGEFEVVEE